MFTVKNNLSLFTKNNLSLFTSLASPVMVNHVTDTIVDVLPRSFSLMQTIPQFLITAGNRLYKPYKNFEYSFAISPFLSTTLTGPFYEEALYRFSIQKLFMKEVPKKIFRHNQNALAFLDSKTAKVARTIVTAYLFATLHYCEARDKNPRLYELGNVSFTATFLGGMIMGLQMELTNNFLHPLISHCVFNIFNQTDL